MRLSKLPWSLSISHWHPELWTPNTGMCNLEKWHFGPSPLLMFSTHLGIKSMHKTLLSLRSVAFGNYVFWDIYFFIGLFIHLFLQIALFWGWSCSITTYLSMFIHNFVIYRIPIFLAIFWNDSQSWLVTWLNTQRGYPILNKLKYTLRTDPLFCTAFLFSFSVHMLYPLVLRTPPALTALFCTKAIFGQCLEYCTPCPTEGKF